MNKIINYNIESIQNNLLLSYEVNHVINNIITTIENHNHNTIINENNKQINELKNYLSKLLINYKSIKQNNTDLNKKLNRYKNKSEIIREKILLDIGQVIKENKNIHLLYEKINYLENNVNDLNYELLSLQNNQQIVSNNDNNKQSIVTNNKSTNKSDFISILHDIEGSLQLTIFSYLDTVDVLSAAQVSKYVYAKIYKLFGIESQLVKSDWSIKPNTNHIKSIDNNNNKQSINNENKSNAITNINTQQSNQITSPITSSLNQSTSNLNNFAESLSKKLTANELKAIINMTDKLKKQSQEIETLKADKEDLNTKLISAENIKDILIDQLRNTELTLKSSMNELNNITKKSTSDQEVITYLDIKNQQLENKNNELVQLSEQMSATIDLQVKSYSNIETKLTTEVNELKSKLESTENNFKSQKKTLIKEVKSLRIQVDELKHERNSYSNQLQILREALNSTVLANNKQSNAIVSERKSLF